MNAGTHTQNKGTLDKVRQLKVQRIPQRNKPQVHSNKIQVQKLKAKEHMRMQGT